MRKNRHVNILNDLFVAIIDLLGGLKSTMSYHKKQSRSQSLRCAPPCSMKSFECVKVQHRQESQALTPIFVVAKLLITSSCYALWPEKDLFHKLTL